MKIVDYSDFNPQNSYWIVDRVDVLPPCTEDLISLASGSLDVNPIIDLLNSINHQNITKLDLVNRTYTLKGKILSLNNLSSGERIFLIAGLASHLQTPVWFGNCVKSLSVSSMKKMFRQFNHCPYVNIVLLDKSISFKDELYYIKEVCGC